MNKKYLFLSLEEVTTLETLKEKYFRKIKTMHEEEYLQFEQSFFTELTYNSNAIEGSSLSLEETDFVINKNIVPEGKSLREIYEAQNHVEALRFLKEYQGDLNEKLILILHSIITKNVLDRFSGAYRKTQVRIFGSNVAFPPADKVPQLIKNLIYWYKKNKNKYHPFELAVLFSMKLVSIHPFVDGNGRVSRLIMNFILQKNGYPWINVYVKQREDYLKAVRKANDEDYTQILDYLIKTLKENLKDFGF